MDIKLGGIWLVSEGFSGDQMAFLYLYKIANSVLFYPY